MTSPEIDSLMKLTNRIPTNRQICIQDPLTHEQCREVEKQFQELQTTSEDILFIFDSAGGDASPGYRLHQIIKASQNHVIGLVDGRAASSAFLVLQGCRTRIATATSFIGIHNPEYYNYNLALKHDTTEEEYLDKQREAYQKYHPIITQYRDKTIQIILERSRMKDPQEVKNFLEKDKLLNAFEALGLGFIDVVV